MTSNRRRRCRDHATASRAVFVAYRRTAEDCASDRHLKAGLRTARRNSNVVLRAITANRLLHYHRPFHIAITLRLHNSEWLYMQPTARSAVMPQLRKPACRPSGLRPRPTIRIFKGTFFQIWVEYSMSKGGLTSWCQDAANYGDEQWRYTSSDVLRDGAKKTRSHQRAKIREIMASQFHSPMLQLRIRTFYYRATLC